MVKRAESEEFKVLKNELLKLLENISDEGSVDEVLSQGDFAKSLIKSGLNLDAFKEKLANDKDFKAYLDSEKDKHSSKALETWKTNNLEKLLSEEIKKRFPEKDEKDIQLESLKAEVEKMKKENILKEIKNQAILMLDEKKLPKDLLDLIVSDDLENTRSNIEALEKVFNPYIQSAVEERVKSNSYTPPTATKTSVDNPYSRETFNLTKQMELEISNPELAKQLKEQAK